MKHHDSNPRGPRVLDNPQLLIISGSAALFAATQPEMQAIHDLNFYNLMLHKDVIERLIEESPLDDQLRDLIRSSSPRGTLDWLARQAEVFIAVEADGTHIGCALFSPVVGRTSGCNVWIAPQYRAHSMRGQLIVSNLANQVLDHAWHRLRLSKLFARCLPADRSAISMMRRLRFREVGYLEAELQLGNRLVDLLAWELVNPAVRANATAGGII